MRKILFSLFAFAVLLIPHRAWAQGSPVCGLNNDETAYLPSQAFGTVTTSGTTVTWSAGTQFSTNWTGTIQLYAPNTGNSSGYTISSVASTTSLTLSSAPTAGTYKYSFNNNYASFTPPAAGSSYVDPLTGCTITRITDSVADGAQYYVYYASQSPFNQNSNYMLIDNNGGFSIRAGVNLSGVTPGTVILSSVGHALWDLSSPTTLYYVSNSTLYKGVLTGTCTSTSNCTLTSTALNNFKTTVGSAGSDYNSAIIQDEPDISQDGQHIAITALNPSGNMDLGLWDLATSTWTVLYTTTCTASAPLSGPQPGCLHKIQIDPLNRLLICFTASGTGNEQGEELIASPTDIVHIQSSTNHLDPGYDINGTPIFVQDRVDSSIGKDPCPGGQWPGVNTTGGGGATMTYFTDPSNANGDAVCVFNKNWSQPHFSYRGGPSQPWVTVSFFDDRSPGPEWLSNSGNYLAPSGTYIGNSTPPSSDYYGYESEIDLVNIANNMNTAGIASLSSVYRMAQARSRSAENFWDQVTATNSHDSNYIAFNSNMANPAGCTSSIETGNGCNDVYVISGASGAPLLGTSTKGGPAPPPPSGSAPAPPTGLTATVN